MYCTFRFQVQNAQQIAQLTDGEAGVQRRGPLAVPNLLRCLAWAKEYAHVKEL
jgi:hypothetical protein